MPLEPNDRLALRHIERHAWKLIEECRDMRRADDGAAFEEACAAMVTTRLDKLKGARRVLVKRGVLSGSNPRVVKAAVIDLESQMK